MKKNPQGATLVSRLVALTKKPTLILVLPVLLSGCMTQGVKIDDTAESKAVTRTSDLLAIFKQPKVKPKPPPKKPVKPVKRYKDDIINRLRKQLVFDIKDNYRISVERKRYLKHAHQLRKIQRRAKPYLFYILNEIERRNLPGELALLPIVESEYKIHARSSSRAAGIWQFMPATGRMYGLKQNWWYDGRKDVAAATHAALKYLTILNHKFKGDWELTLAAYNAGGGKVRRAQKRNLLKGKPTDYWSLDLPRETKRYVAKLYALTQIFSDPKKYGVHLIKIKDKQQVSLIKTNSQIDLGLAAELTGVNIKTIRRLNPGHKRWATDPKGPHKLFLPAKKASLFLDRLVALPPEKRIHHTRHKIKRGENLLTIAKNYGASVASIRKANRFKGNTIRAGKSILIPAPYDKKKIKDILPSLPSEEETIVQSTPEPAPQPEPKTEPAEVTTNQSERNEKESAAAKFARSLGFFGTKKQEQPAQQSFTTDH